MNYQNWHGITDGRYGYGSMLNGFLGHVPDGITISEKASVDVLMSVPFATPGWLKGAHRVIFTMWETDRLPNRFVRWIPEYDQVIVPCMHNVDVFGDYHDHVYYVPLGYDPSFWTPMQQGENGMFRFTAGGSLWKRKGLDLVVKAFEMLHLRDAELVIKAAPHAADTPKGIDVRNVRLVRTWMSPEEERDFYNSSDCFVAPARGEGFGLIPLQNIGLGIPTVITATSGQRQFAHLATAVCDTKPVKASVGRWDEANVQELASQMMWVYENRDRARRQALRNAATAAQEFSWELASLKLAATLPDGTLLRTTQKVPPRDKFPCRVRTTCSVEVNNIKEEFYPGVEYNVSENTHDILADAGYLEN